MSATIQARGGGARKTDSLRAIITAMRAVRVAVIGAGFMGERHARIYAGLPDVELVAVCDVRDAAARELAERTGAVAYSDFRSCSGETISMRSACARRTGSTGSRASEPFERGRHVLLEKPIATTVEDAEAIVAAARRAGAVLLVGHCLRFDPRYDQARQAVARGELGPIQTIYTRRANTVAAQDRLGGRCSLPLFLGVHDYDVMRWLAGSEVERVTAESKWGFLREPGLPGGGCQLRAPPIRERRPRHRGAQLDPAPGIPCGGRPPAGPGGERGLAVDRDARDRASPRGWAARDPGGHGGSRRLSRVTRAACSTSSSATSSTASAGVRRPPSRRTMPSRRSASRSRSSEPRRRARPSPSEPGARARRPTIRTIRTDRAGSACSGTARSPGRSARP